MIAWWSEHYYLVLGVAGSLFYLFSFAMAADAIMKNRTSQGAVAWATALITFPYLALPLYLFFGRQKFEGYVKARQTKVNDLVPVVEKLVGHVPEFRAELGDHHQRYVALERLAYMPFTHSNSTRLLIDGEETFSAIFSGIESAENYIIAQYYIITDDEIGNEFSHRLARKARSGVRVLLLYDPIGCLKLPSSYIQNLRDAGVEVQAFRGNRKRANRFQLNFRNHRKLVLVDGRRAYIGGLNVGDEYMGRNPKFGHWRDTHLEVTGPAVQCLQIAFLEDWYSSVNQIPELEWTPAAASHENRNMLILPSGSADKFETCSLFFLHCINRAYERIWIASPYFVPDAPIVKALKLAALRGVDVRLLLPAKADHKLVYLASFSYLDETEPAGVRVFRYQPGFLHYKALLVDDYLSAVGTANLDNRSFRLNFEMTAVVADHEFAGQVESMFQTDFDRSREAHLEDLVNRPIWFRIGAQTARLFAPLL